MPLPPWEACLGQGLSSNSPSCSFVPGLVSGGDVPTMWGTNTDVYFIATLSFLWKVSVITLVSCLPLYVLKYLRRRFSPPSYSKLTS
ncbi:hypothetical protein P7K49_009913 [Saguinus oedipus]|uniref:Uncharacterized protein n=1 Tax=Saguinus oedipus TaxID=9490 RepID=A0ABQ9VPI8_SAGOE|nr:hypothetical protein P7K49_009913 [Saguinus oedipus]